MQIDGETVETVADFIFLGSRITVDGDCSHEIKRCLLLGRKAMTNLDSILKSRDFTLPTKVCLVKAMVFPVVMYGCESWDYKESWALKNWCFWTLVLEKTLESPLDCKEIQSDHLTCLLRNLYGGHEATVRTGRGTMDWFQIGKGVWQGCIFWTCLHQWKRPWCWERLKTGEGDNRGWDGWMASLTQWTWILASSRRWWRIGKPGMLQSMESQRLGHSWVIE